MLYQLKSSTKKIERKKYAKIGENCTDENCTKKLMLYNDDAHTGSNWPESPFKIISIPPYGRVLFFACCNLFSILANFNLDSTENSSVRL